MYMLGKIEIISYSLWLFGHFFYLITLSFWTSLFFTLLLLLFILLAQLVFAFAHGGLPIKASLPMRPCNIDGDSMSNLTNTSLTLTIHTEDYLHVRTWVLFLFNHFFGTCMPSLVSILFGWWGFGLPRLTWLTWACKALIVATKTHPIKSDPFRNLFRVSF